MTLLLYILLLAFILIEAPLIALMIYLYNHITLDQKISQMRRIIFVIAFAKALFILAQIILVFSGLIKFDDIEALVIWSYSLSVFILAIVDWWAFFTIRKMIT